MFYKFTTGKLPFQTTRHRNDAEHSADISTAESPTVKMKYLAAYLLLALGGNESPSAADIEKVLSSVGIEADSERVGKVVGELEGKDINEVWAP